MARRGEARQDMGASAHGGGSAIVEARYGWARRGWARHGLVRRGLVRQDKVKATEETQPPFFIYHPVIRFPEVDQPVNISCYRPPHDT